VTISSILYRRDEKMSCYIRHLDEVLKEAGIEVTKENSKKVDEAIHRVVEVEYKNCPDTWKAVKDQLVNDRGSFIEKVRAEMSKEG
jgi:predicted Fe-Mo cluster-binding NifX family protein